MFIHPRLFALMRDVIGWMILNITISLGIVAAAVGQGFLIAIIVARIFDGSPWQHVLPLVGWIAALIGIRTLLVWGRDTSSMATAAAVKQKLRQRIYQHLLALGPGYLARERTGFVLATMVDGVEQLEDYLGKYIPQAFAALIASIAILALMFSINPIIGVVILVSLLLIVTGPRFWDRLLGEYGQKHWSAYGRLKAQFLDAMQGMTTLKAFNASATYGQELQRDSFTLYRTTMVQLAVSLISTGIVGLGWTAGSALAVGVGALLLINGSLTFFELLMVLMLGRECFRPLVELDKYWHFGFYGLSASTHIFALLDREPELAVSPDAIVAEPGITRPQITFQNVSFAYNDGSRPALHSLSFTVAPNETVALVGRSGAGKSTISALLLRFFDPQAGMIMLDNHDLRTYNLATLQRMIALVAQDTYLFHGTIAENLRLAQPEATQADLEVATRAANIHDFIAGLPQGYATVVGERGLKLSGGERQRIAIARALLKDAPILILDEATANVDAASEVAIQEALERLSVHRTTLVIAHRLSTIVNADRIVVLDQGEAVEVGDHRTLLAREGVYARLVAAQA
ncbi:MAG: ABC transporter ATP-binding protein/permease [Chloroflexales bacterium]|nr:ABC transporter ATP-binding protein/permease [Chloroflexales bacterium]